MTPQPNSPHASEILQGFWESSIDPADLMRRSLGLTTLATLATELINTGADGQVRAVQLLNFGQGALAEVISGAWSKYFLNVATVGGNVAQAGAPASPDGLASSFTGPSTGLGEASTPAGNPTPASDFAAPPNTLPGRTRP